MLPPKIFIIKEQMVRNEVGSVPMDYSRAQDYGDLEFITLHDLPMYSGRSSTQEAWNEDVIRFVKMYDPARDFIITTGQPAAIFMVGWILGAMDPVKIPRFLVWRREEGRYRPLQPDVSSVETH